MAIMRRMFALSLLVAGVLAMGGGLWDLQAAPSSQWPGRCVLFVLGACLVFIAWRLDRKPPDPLVFPLPERDGPMDVSVNRAAVWGTLLLALFVWWVCGAALLFKLQLSHAGWIALGLATVLSAWPMRRLLRAERALRLDVLGLEHYRFGRIPWTDIDGIRMQAMTIKGRTVYTLVLRLAHPRRYEDRVGGLQRRMLDRMGHLGMPLQYMQAPPIAVFEAATRLRGAVEPPAMTGWSGDLAAIQRMVAWMAAQPTASLAKAGPGSDARRRFDRVTALVAAMAGGWGPLDTADMAKRRLEAVRLKARRDEQVVDETVGRLREATAVGVPVSPATMEAMHATATAAFARSAEGRRMTELEAQLRVEGGARLRRQQRQLAWLIGSALAIWIVAHFIS